MKGWRTYYNLQSTDFGYNVIYNETHARLKYWTSTSQTHPTTMTAYQTVILNDTWIRPAHPVEALAADGRAVYQVRDNRGTLSHKSITGASFNSTIYIQMQWVHKGLI